MIFNHKLYFFSKIIYSIYVFTFIPDIPRERMLLQSGQNTAAIYGKAVRPKDLHQYTWQPMLVPTNSYMSPFHKSKQKQPLRKSNGHHGRPLYLARINAERFFYLFSSKKIQIRYQRSNVSLHHFKSKGQPFST